MQRDVLYRNEKGDETKLSQKKIDICCVFCEERGCALDAKGTYEGKKVIDG